MRLLAFMAAVVLACVLLPRRSDACEPGWSFQEALPAKGATHVPPTALVWIFYDIGGDASVRPNGRLLDASGSEVATTPQVIERGDVQLIRDEVLVLTPTQPLGAGSYTVEVFGNGSVTEAAQDHVFTVTEDAVDAVPIFSGADEVDVTLMENCAPIGDCLGWPSKNRFLVRGEPANAAVYRLYRSGTLVDVSRTSTAVFDLPVSGAGGQAECFTLRAVNVSGEEDGNAREVCAREATGPALSCRSTEEGPPEQGPPEQGPPEQGPPEQGGCGCRVMHGSNPRAALALAVVVCACLRSRLRRPRK